MISGVRTIGAGVRNHKMISAVIGRRGTSAAIVNPTLTPLRYKGKYRAALGQRQLPCVEHGLPELAMLVDEFEGKERSSPLHERQE